MEFNYSIKLNRKIPIIIRIFQFNLQIKRYITNTFGYDLNRTINEIRPDYIFDESCQGTVPEAIIAFLESDDYEHAVRLAVSLGGDSDTIFRAMAQQKGAA